jgi:M6 family metalloprotease-like protein
MKKSNKLGSAYLLSILAGCMSLANAAPYGRDGYETQWTQPNGKELTIRVFGDEFYGRAETAAGFTVIYNPASRAYEYARLAADGTSLIPSGVDATRPAPANVQKSLELPAAQIKLIREKNRRTLTGDREESWNKRVKAVRNIRLAAQGGPALKGPAAAEAKLRAAPVTGAIRGLTIIAQFPDDPNTTAADPINFPTSKAKIERYANGVGYTEDGNTGSVRDYFFDQSLGKLEYTQTVTEIITLPRPRNYYNYSDYPVNSEFHPEAGRALLLDAIEVLKSQDFDFTALTTNSSNEALATNIFFAGRDSGVWSEGLWPHQWSLKTPVSVGTTGTPVSISQYQITNLANSSPSIGTFCHENGHLILDYPDLYDYDGGADASEGVGAHCIMGSGNQLNRGRTPGPLNGFFKDIVGWGNLLDLTPEDFLTASLKTTGNTGYRIRKPDSSTEYFVVENRGDGDKWAQYSPDKGIAIWHIDETVSGNNSQEMTEDEHYQVSLEQADGRFDLESNRNRGDNRDLFDLNTSKFSDTTTPNARWWDGTRSSVAVEVLSPAGSSTEVLFGRVPPNTIILGSPNGGETIFPSSTYKIIWKANIVGNVRIDVLKGGAFHSSITKDAPNTGSFNWKVRSTIESGSDYSIRMRSVTNPIVAIDTSDKPFSISDTTFPVAGKMPYGWFTPSSAGAKWRIEKSEVYEGTHSLVTAPMIDGKTAAIAYQSNFKEGTVSFYMKISSESGFDFGRFYIDGKRQAFPAALGKNGISGEVEWTFFSFPISAGTHTLQWTYEKDDSYSELKDRVWLDGVSLPETTQEIAIENPQGLTLSSGGASTVFPETTIESTSNPQIFTIKNIGLADLTNLKLITKGAFIASALKTKVLAPGKSTRFTVAFAPKKTGLQVGSVQVLSNDNTVADFLIPLEGTALGLPSIRVNQPTGTPLVDGQSTRKFGKAVTGTLGASKTFAISNAGSATLSGLAITKNGSGRRDFIIDGPVLNSLAPGESTTFRVTFSPGVTLGTRIATLSIASNDAKAGPFDLTVSGVSDVLLGSGSSFASYGSSARQSSSTGQLLAAPVTTVEVLNGQKFLTLSVAKPAGHSTAPIIEVSPNLLDWYSGSKHTTVLTDNDSVLKVRDNTPVSPEVKRYIRVK